VHGSALSRPGEAFLKRKVNKSDHWLINEETYFVAQQHRKWLSTRQYCWRRMLTRGEEIWRLVPARQVKPGVSSHQGRRPFVVWLRGLCPRSQEVELSQNFRMQRKYNMEETVPFLSS
jgi:hypothetical protein